jgi:hypothetical protein
MPLQLIRNILIVFILLALLFPFKEGYRESPSKFAKEKYGTSSFKVGMGLCFAFTEPNKEQIRAHLMREGVSIRIIESYEKIWSKITNDTYLYSSAINLKKTALVVSPLILLLILTILRMGMRLSPPLRSPQQSPLGHSVKSKYLAIKNHFGKSEPTQIAVTTATSSYQREEKTPEQTENDDSARRAKVLATSALGQKSSIRQIQIAHQCIKHVQSLDEDGARHANGVGFNSVDTDYGKRLANKEQSYLTNFDKGRVLQLAWKYRKQARTHLAEQLTKPII